MYSVKTRNQSATIAVPEEKPIPKKRTGSFSIKPTAPPIPKKQSSVGQGIIIVE